MACEKYLDLISARLDGELSAGEQAELDAHLQTCPACRAIANDLKGLHSTLADLGEVPAPAELSRRVMSKIKTEKQQNRRRVVRTLTALAACLVLCAGVLRITDATYSGLTRGSDTGGSAQSELAPADQSANEAAPACIPDTARHIPAAASEALSFSNRQRLRLSAVSTSFTPTADLLGDPQDLAQYLARFPYDDLSAVTEACGEDFFRTRRLLAVVVCEPSSSITHTISRLTGDSVTILRHVPEAGDSDIALWLILAEVEGAGPSALLSAELLDN